MTALTGKMMREININTGHGKVYGQAAGEPSSPLVLGIHGWSQRNGWNTWAPLLQPLGLAGFYAVTVDMPGWGKSLAWRKEPMDADEGVRVLAAIIAGLDKVEASIMGKSWGGGVALELAIRHPNMVRNLILSAPAFHEFDRLSDLRQPVLLAWSKDDPVIPYGFARSFAKVIPSMKLVTYESGGHSAGPKNADSFAPLVIEFLLSA
jgi:pimeloyl-ACP methyl ester carboxylesterase